MLQAQATSYRRINPSKNAQKTGVTRKLHLLKTLAFTPASSTPLTILMKLQNKTTESYEKATKIGVINYTFKNTGLYTSDFTAAITRQKLRLYKFPQFLPSQRRH